MTYKFETQPKNDYLLYTISGVIDSVTNALNYIRTIVISAQKQGHYRILVDERNVTRKMDRYDCVN